MTISFPSVFLNIFILDEYIFSTIELLNRQTVINNFTQLQTKGAKGKIEAQR